MARMSITFNGFNNLAEEIDKIGGQSYLKEATEEALQKTADYIQDNVKKAAQPYSKKDGGLSTNNGGHGYATPEMYKAIKTQTPVIWKGSVAEVSVGFDLYKKGGYHSIFLMYGTPKISKDKRLYNSIKGNQTRKDIAKIQESIMNDYLSLGGKK